MTNFNNSFKEQIPGARTFKNFFAITVLFLAGLSFFLVGLSSYFHQNFFFFTNTSEILFIPQGITMLFYGTLALGLCTYLLFTFVWDVGSGYNEFSKEEEVIRIIRIGFPGNNQKIFLSYDFKNIKKIKLFIKQGLNPRSNILLVLKDKREIPLYPAQIVLNPTDTEKKAIAISEFLQIPLESTLI